MSQNPRISTVSGWKDLFQAMWRLATVKRTEPVGRWQKTYAGLVLMWEKMAPEIWPYGLALSVFIVAALFDLPQLLPGLLHSILLAILAAYLIYGLIFVIRNWRWPSDAEIYHRIELDSDLPHRPLTALRDQAVGGSGDQQKEWWRQYQAQVRSGLRGLYVEWPRFGFAPFDPYALRSIILLFIVIGVMLAGRDSQHRLWHAIRPDVPPASSLLHSLTVWVRPPEYTKLAQIPLKPGQTETTQIPEGSQVYVQFSGVKSAPSFYVDSEKQQLTQLTDDAYQANVTIGQAKYLKANVGWQTLGKWPVQVIADQPPMIGWDGELYATSRAAMRVGYKGQDDYGIAKAFAEITKPGETETIMLKLPVFNTAKKEVKNSSYHDVAYHRWAGQNVKIRLIAYDAVGHKTESAFQETTLPNRTFEHKVAVKIASARRQFMDGQIDRKILAAGMDEILRDPAAFEYDPKVTLGLRVAERRAALADDGKQDGSIADLLWDVALRLEDSGVSLAERDLRSLEQALQDALARGAGQEEIDNLLDQFEEAMNNYLMSMYEEMVDQGLEDFPSIDSTANSVDVQDIDRLLMQIRQLMRSGNSEEAQKLLSKLQEIMANVRQNEGKQTEANKAALELIKKAQGLVRDQQSALDYGASRLVENQTVSAAITGKIKSDQKPVQADLKNVVAQIEKFRLPKIESYAKAGAAIESVLKSADAKQPDKIKRENILTHQAQALEQLRMGLQELIKSMQDSGGSSQMRAGSGRRDPFGKTRPGQGVLDDPSVRVPGVQELEQTKEILDELQRRSGDFGRPEVERDYIKRLLRRF